MKLTIENIGKWKEQLDIDFREQSGNQSARLSECYKDFKWLEIFLGKDHSEIVKTELDHLEDMRCYICGAIRN